MWLTHAHRQAHTQTDDDGIYRSSVAHSYTYNRFTALSGTTQVSRHQKGKTNLDLLEQQIVSGSGIS